MLRSSHPKALSKLAGNDHREKEKVERPHSRIGTSGAFIRACKASRNGFPSPTFSGRAACQLCHPRSQRAHHHCERRVEEVCQGKRSGRSPCIERVGSPQTIRTYARIIAATNRNLEKEVREKHLKLPYFQRSEKNSARQPQRSPVESARRPAVSATIGIVILKTETSSF